MQPTGAGIPESRVESENWLNAHYDPVASVFTLSQCMTLCNIHGDGDIKLIVADLGPPLSREMKLKVFKGTRMVHETTILDLPTALVSFYLDQNEPRTPAVAVASGSCIYVYKNLKPFFKFNLPKLPLNPKEEEAWKMVTETNGTARNLRDSLEVMRSEGMALSARSLRLLQVDQDQLDDFFQAYKSTPLKRETVATCMGSLPRSHSEEDSISCLVVGTEAQQIFILDPEAFTVLAAMNLPHVPVFINVSGVYDVEFRILVACRNGAIYQLKRGSKTAGRGIEPGAQIVGMARINKNIYVGCMDDTLQCFSPKARRLWSIKLPSSITTMQHIQSVDRDINFLAVAFNDSTVRLYRDKHLVDHIPTEDVVTGLVFGVYGHESATMLMCTRGGGLVIKLLKRSADFQKTAEIIRGPPPQQFQRLDIPRKTKLFVDQTVRERENAVAMHRQFMQDLAKLRLKTARGYLEVLETRATPISTDPQEPLKLSAQVQGMGPSFRLVVTLQNTGTVDAATNLFISFVYDPAFYHVETPYIAVPYLVPGIGYPFSTLITAVNDRGVADEIKVFVMRPKREVPIITGIINMPVSEAKLTD